MHSAERHKATVQNEAVRIGIGEEIWKAEGEMKKYIVKNCPALNLPLFEDYEEPAIKNGCMQEETGCEEISNCLIKQIVELCGKQKKWESEKMESGQIIEIYNGAYDFAQEVLGLLEIQEFGNE